MKNIKDEVEKCLKIYENFHKQTTANDIFKIFYEIENRLKNNFNKNYRKRKVMI